MNIDDLGFHVDPALDNRLRRTLHEVAATVADDVSGPDQAGKPTFPAPDVSVRPSSDHQRQRRSWARRNRVRLVAGAGTAVAAALALVFSLGGPGADRQAPEAIALGDDALPSPMRYGGNACLAGARETGQLGPDVRPTLVNFVEHDWQSIVIYQTDGRLIYCMVNLSPKNKTPLGGVASYGNNSPLPGPIGLDLMATDGLEGFYMATAGRVSSRVARVMFDDGAGHVKQARLANGTFATAGAYGKRDKALVISYDHAGKEIDRRLAFGTSCDPNYRGTDARLPGTTCEPSEVWTPAATPPSRVG